VIRLPAAKPLPLLIATDVFVEAQVTELVRFWVAPSLNALRAVNSCTPPSPVEAFAGVTARDTLLVFGSKGKFAWV
jgi:hypothetical protein